MARTVRHALTLLVLVLATAFARAGEQVDLLLVLAADVSRSVDHLKFQLQREGYAAAIADKRVLEAIGSGRNRRIAVSFVEWSGISAQRVVIDWTVIDGEQAARKFGDQLLELPRSFAERTAIGAAIDFSMNLLERAPHESARRTIAVAGDGTNNSGRDVTIARAEALAKGVTINALAILSERPLTWNPEHTNPPGGLPNYFRNNVIGGPGAFVIVAEDFNSFGQAIIKKLIAEIAGVPPAQTITSVRTACGPEKPCRTTTQSEYAVRPIRMWVQPQSASFRAIPD
jgi:hypothetical protein